MCHSSVALCQTIGLYFFEKCLIHLLQLTMLCFFYHVQKVLGCADEDMAQAAKDGIVIYSQEGTGSISGSVGCCSMIESEFEDDNLGDLGLKFKALAEMCQSGNVNSGVQMSQYKSYEELNQGALASEVITDIRGVQNEEAVEHFSSESHVQRVEPESVVRDSVVTGESFVSSRYVQEPVMRGNILVTEKSYTTAPSIILEPVRQQNVLVTERVVRPAFSFHNLGDVSEGENVMVTERVFKSDKGGFSGFINEPSDSQYMLVTERRLGNSSNQNASISIPAVSMGQNVVVTERHYTPITTVNGSARIPVAVSGGKTEFDGGVLGQMNFQNRVDEIHPASNNVEMLSSRVTKYGTEVSYHG